MRVPIWKKWISHLWPLELEVTTSQYNPYLGVRLSSGRLQLVSANAVYSFEDLYINFDLAYQAINWDLVGRKRALFLGFGLGSAVQLLSKHEIRFQQITGVERDEAVLYLANKYLGPVWAKLNIEFVVADALDYVHQVTGPYDLIVMDVFEDDVIPSKLQTVRYLSQLKHLLNNNGLLLYNALADNKQDIANSRMFIKDSFLEVFKEGGFIEVAKNYIIYSHKKFIL